MLRVISLSAVRCIICVTKCYSLFEVGHPLLSLGASWLVVAASGGRGALLRAFLGYRLNYRFRIARPRPRRCCWQQRAYIYDYHIIYVAYNAHIHIQGVQRPVVQPVASSGQRHWELRTGNKKRPPPCLFELPGLQTAFVSW
jgi:hypothetical protein